MAGTKNNIFELSKPENSSSEADSSAPNSSRLDLNSIFAKESTKNTQVKVNPEVNKFVNELEGESALSCAIKLSFRLSVKTPAQAKTFVTELKQAQNSKYSPELILSTANKETTVEFLDTKDKSKTLVAKITDTEVQTEFGDKSSLKQLHDVLGDTLKSSTDAQLFAMGNWTVGKATWIALDALKGVKKFSPKGALAELAMGAVIAAALAPPLYEYFIKDHEEKAKHK